VGLLGVRSPYKNVKWEFGSTRGLEDVPVPRYLDLDCVSAKELNIGIGMLKERNH
jgi:hypothetical protein